MEELQRGRGTMPRPSYVDSDGLTPLQALRQRELVGNAQRLYSTLSARRQQQLAETIGMMSPAILPEPPGRRSSIPPRRSVDAHLEPLPRTPGTPDFSGRLSQLGMATPSPAFLSFRATDEDIVDQARLHAARIKDLEAELKLSRMETELALNNQAEIQFRSDRLSQALQAERATRAAERIADAVYDAQQDRVDALSKAAVAQERRAAAMHKNVGLRLQLADAVSASPEALEAELRRYHGADNWMEEEEDKDREAFAYQPTGWQVHYPQRAENRGEPLAETRQHAEDFLHAHPRYRQHVTAADLVAARVFTLETSRYRERLNLACRQMADWRYIDCDVDNPPPQFAHMYFHLKRAVTALKGAKNEARLYRLEPGFYDLLEDAACEVGKVVTWHEFTPVMNLSKPAEALLLASVAIPSGGDDSTCVDHGRSLNGGVLYRIEPSAECGHHFGDLGAYLCTEDPLSISARTDPDARTELLLPPGACFRVKKRATEGRVEAVTMEYIGMWVDAFPTNGGDGYATMQQVEEDASAARAEYEEARLKCDAFRRRWETAYEEWQDAVAALRTIGGTPPVDAETELLDALAVARTILRERREPEPEPEPEPETEFDSSSPTQNQLDAVLGEADWQAATTVQARQRGNAARKRISEQQTVATKRQAAQRSNRAREHVSEQPGANTAVSKRSQKLNAKSTFEPDGSGRVWGNTDQERAILYLTHK